MGEVDSAAGLARGVMLAIGDGDEADVMRVVAVDGTAVEVGRYRWRHQWLYRVRRLAAWAWMWLRIGAETAREALCRWRGHRLTREGPIAGYRNRLRYCWCSEKRQRVPAWPIVREDGTEISEPEWPWLLVPPGDVR
jgi:hypothetical protein